VSSSNAAASPMKPSAIAPAPYNKARPIDAPRRARWRE
jgi:hypothetical protein